MPGPGDTLDGRYRLDRPLARGGFATVFLATHLRLGRPVAVKVLDPALLAAADARDFLARFAQEAATVAQLDHPHILGIHDYGEADGTAYLVMPHVPGGTLHDRLRAGPLPPAWAAHYLRQAAAALDHAHARGLVHRDVKPQNMLLSADGERLLLADFGIARLLEGTSAQASLVVGTVAYMAPEQLDGRVTRATDVYALGCVAIELLTGRPPYDGSLHQVMHAHLHLPAPALVERGGPHLAAYQPAIDRALAKDPAARFPAAGDLARALDAAHAAATSPTAPVLAPPAPHPATIIAPPREDPPPAAPTVALPAPASAQPEPIAPGYQDVAALLDREAPHHPDAATLHDQADRARRDQAGGTPPSPQRGAPPARGGRRAAPRLIAVAAAALVVALILAIGLPRVLDRPPAPPTTTAATLTGHNAAVNGLAWSRDGKTLASSGDNTVRLWAADGAPRKTLTGHDDTVRAVAWSPGSVLASASADKTVRLWAADGTAIATLTGHTGGVYGVAWSPDGKTLASASDDKTVRLWAADGTPRKALTGHTGTVTAVAWSPNGRALASASADTTVRLWAADGTPIATLPGHTSAVTAVAWSPDGKTLASGSNDKTVRLWAADGTLRKTLDGHTDRVNAVAWSPDGRTLASGSTDRAVRLWATDGTAIATLTGHTNAVRAVAWSPDDHTLATGSDDKTVRLWR